MITNAIVLASLLLAALYFICWLFRRDFRRQVEQPKYRFQRQLDRFEGHGRRPPGKEDTVHEQQ